MAEAAVIGCHTEELFNQQLQLAVDTNRLVVIDFSASWCGPCRAIAPFFAELARRHSNVIFLKVDVDELGTVARDWAIEAMPTFIFLKDGTIVDKVIGARRGDLPRKIQQHMNQ